MVRLIIQVTGSRDWHDRSRVRQAIADTVHDADVPWEAVLVVHGAARGADIIAGQEAHALGCQVAGIPADWDQFGRSAGPRRNRLMLDYTLNQRDRYDCPVRVLAFKANFDPETGRGGTEHMVKLCREAGLHGRIIRR